MGPADLRVPSSPNLTDRTKFMILFHLQTQGAGRDVTLGAGRDVTLGAGRDVTLGAGRDVETSLKYLILNF